MKLHFSSAQWMLGSPIYQKFYWLYCYCTFYVCNQARCFWHEGMVYHPNKEESNKFCHESLACKMGWYSARIRSTLPEALLDRCSFHFLVPCRTSAQLKIHSVICKTFSNENLQSHLWALVVTVQRISRVPYRQFKIYRFVAELLVYHSGVHYRREQEEFLVPRISGFVNGYRRLYFDLWRRHLHVIAYFCPNGY